MILFRYALAVATLASIVSPDEGLGQDLRPGDRAMTPNELSGMLSGRAVEFYDGSVARYGEDGSYSYTYSPGDPPFNGRYGTSANSQVCVTFDNGFDRCDTYVLAGEGLVLIIADGTRFPVRAIAPMD